MLEAVLVGLLVQAALLLAEAGARWLSQQLTAPA